MIDSKTIELAAEASAKSKWVIGQYAVNMMGFQDGAKWLQRQRNTFNVEEFLQSYGYNTNHPDYHRLLGILNSFMKAIP